MGNALLAVFLGGGLGSVLRFVFSLIFRPWTSSFPFHTLAANVLACVVFALYLRVSPSFSFLQHREPFLLAGFCGGLSTFSTFSYDTLTLFYEKKYLLFSVNILSNLVLCLLFFFLIFPKKSA